MDIIKYAIITLIEPPMFKIGGRLWKKPSINLRSQ